MKKTFTGLSVSELFLDGLECPICHERKIFGDIFIDPTGRYLFLDIQCEHIPYKYSLNGDILELEYTEEDRLTAVVQ